MFFSFRYQSLIGTVGKKFAKKRKRSEVADSDDEQVTDEKVKPEPRTHAMDVVPKLADSKFSEKPKTRGKAYRFMKPVKN